MDSNAMERDELESNDLMDNNRVYNSTIMDMEIQ